MWNKEPKMVYVTGGAGVTQEVRVRRVRNPTEFCEAYLSGIERNQTTGTFLVSYRGGRPIRIREVNELAQR